MPRWSPQWIQRSAIFMRLGKKHSSEGSVQGKRHRGCAAERGHASRLDCGRLLTDALFSLHAPQVTTDNGGALEECKPNGASNYPLRGGKCSVWEGGTRGTALIYGPGLPAGLHWPGLFHGADWLPTLLCAAGATLQAAVGTQKAQKSIVCIESS